MSEHIAIVEWKRSQAKFTDNKYSREHTWKFDGGVEVAASASPHVVPIPYSNPTSAIGAKKLSWLHCQAVTCFFFSQ